MHIQVVGAAAYIDSQTSMLLQAEHDVAMIKHHIGNERQGELLRHIEVLGQHVSINAVMEMLSRRAGGVRCTETDVPDRAIAAGHPQKVDVQKERGKSVRWYRECLCA